MVLESANCTECRSEVLHNDNYCQECGTKTSTFSQRDTNWRKVPTGPSWSRDPIEVEPSWKKTSESIWQKPTQPTWSKPASDTTINQKTTESSWNQNTEPTPIRSFVQSAAAPHAVPMPEPMPQPVAPPPPPLPPVQAIPVEPAAEPKVEPTVEPKVEPVMAKTPPPETAPIFMTPSPVEAKPKEEEPAVKDIAEVTAKPIYLGSPLLRPRITDQSSAEPPSKEKGSTKGKVSSILWLCVCFLAGILIYCLFDILKMTVLKQEAAPFKQQPAVVAPVKEEVPVVEPAEPKAVEKPVEEAPVIEKPGVSVTPAKSIPIKAISVSPVSASQAVVPKPVLKPVSKTVVPTRLPEPKVQKVAPLIAPEVVKPRASAESSNASRTRTVWEAPATPAKAPVVTAPTTPSRKNPVVSTVKGTNGDLARYNRLLADYFSRAGNGSFGDESGEPPTYSEWLSRGKPEF